MQFADYYRNLRVPILFFMCPSDTFISLFIVQNSLKETVMSRRIMTVLNTKEAREAIKSIGAGLDLYNQGNPYISLRPKSIFTVMGVKHVIDIRNIGKIQGRLGTVDDIYALGLLDQSLYPDFLDNVGK